MPRFKLKLTGEVLEILADLDSKPAEQARCKKIKKALGNLEVRGPHYPGLHTQRYFRFKGPKGEIAWESYVENNTPSAWRIWWSYGPSQGEITVFKVGPHP